MSLARSLSPRPGKGPCATWSAGLSCAGAGVSIKELERRTGVARNDPRGAALRCPADLSCGPTDACASSRTAGGASEDVGDELMAVEPSPTLVGGIKQLVGHRECRLLRAGVRPRPQPLGQAVEHVGDRAHPAHLPARVREHVARGGPRAERVVADHELGLVRATGLAPRITEAQLSVSRGSRPRLRAAPWRRPHARRSPSAGTAASSPSRTLVDEPVRRSDGSAAPALETPRARPASSRSAELEDRREASSPADSAAPGRSRRLRARASRGIGSTSVAFGERRAYFGKIYELNRLL